MSTNETKRKAQVALRKFQDVAQLHLEFLKERRDNIRKYRLLGDIRALSIEKSRADLVVKQLYDDVQQMFTWCSDLDADTWEWVQRQLRPLNTQIQLALSDFLNECGTISGDTQQPREPVPVSESGNSSRTHRANTQRAQRLWLEEESHEDAVSDEGIQRSQKMALLSDQLQERRVQAEAHRQLLSDVLELNEVMKEMDAVVRVQGDTVETIEGNVDRAVTNVDAGERNIFKAMKTKAAGYPIAGAIIGAGAAAGPVGLLVGLKVAVVAAIGGSAVGAISGHLLRKKAVAESSNNLEMKTLIAAPTSDAKTSRRKAD